MKIIKNKKILDKIYFLFFTIIILYLLYKIIYFNNIKEHFKKKKITYPPGSYQYIAKKGSVQGKKLVSNIGMTATGVGYGIYLIGDFVKYLIVDVPKDVMKLADGGSRDPIGQVFGD